MLGELNGSHTGARYYPDGASLRTATLGLFYDDNYQGNGLKVEEVIKRGPFDERNTGVKAGDIIEKIDGQPILKDADFTSLLDGKAGQRVRVSVFSPAKKKHFDVVVKAISRSQQDELLYRRWVDRNRAVVDSLSHGTVGYVHVEAMDSRKPSARCSANCSATRCGRRKPSSWTSATTVAAGSTTTSAHCSRASNTPSLSPTANTSATTLGTNG